MDIRLDFFSIFGLITIIQGLFLFLLMFFRADRREKRNFFLALFVLTFTYANTNFVRDYSGLKFYAPHLIFTEIPVSFLIGPFLYFHARRLTGRQNRIGLQMIPHFLLPLIAVLVYFPFYFQSGDDKLYYITTLPHIIDYRLDVIVIAHHIQMFFYFIISRRIIGESTCRKDTERQQNLTPDLQRLVEFTTLLLVVYAVRSAMLATVIIQKFMPYNFIVILFTSASIIFYMSYRLFMEPVITRYRGSGTTTRLYFSDEDAAIFINALERFMAEKRPFLDPDVTIDELAAAVGLKRHQFSELLNRYVKKSFNDYINSYRVREAERLLAESGREANILSIAMHSGFNTKQTFNSAFKKFTGLTSVCVQKRGPCRLGG